MLKLDENYKSTAIFCEFVNDLKVQQLYNSLEHWVTKTQFYSITSLTWKWGQNIPKIWINLWKILIFLITFVVIISKPPSSPSLSFGNPLSLGDHVIWPMKRGATPVDLEKWNLWYTSNLQVLDTLKEEQRRGRERTMTQLVLRTARYHHRLEVGTSLQYVYNVNVSGPF